MASHHFGSFQSKIFFCDDASNGAGRSCARSASTSERKTTVTIAFAFITGEVTEKRPLKEIDWLVQLSFKSNAARGSGRGRNVEIRRSFESVESDYQLEAFAKVVEKWPMDLFVERPDHKAGAIGGMFLSFLLPGGGGTSAHFFVNDIAH